MAKKFFNKPLKQRTNKPKLSDREKEVAHLMLELGNAKSVARKLNISESAVRHHFSNIRLKMNDNKTFSAILKAIRYKLMDK